jgi:hypothetical protein
MANYTPLLFHRNPSQLYPHLGQGRDAEDDTVSLYSVAEVALPRITSRNVKRRDVQVRKIERPNDSVPVSCDHLYSSQIIKEDDMSEVKGACMNLAGQYNVRNRIYKIIILPVFCM